MSLDSLTNRIAYIGNGATSVYAYTFRIQVEADLLIVVSDGTTETTLSLTTDYTLSGVMDEAGGNVTLVNASQAWLASGNLKSNYILVLRREPALTQETDIRNQGAYFPEIHEDEFDKGRMIDQALENKIDRSVKLPESVTPATFDPTLPLGIAVANRALITNSTGDGLAVGPDATTVASGLAVLQYLGLGAIAETHVSLPNNQAVAANVTGFLVSPTFYRAAIAWVSIRIKTDSSESIATGWYVLSWRTASSTWDISPDLLGDDTGVTLSITAGGQVQATTSNIAGTNYSGAITFKVMTFST